MTARATKGGQIGKNGEFYKGGTFLPSTQLAKQSPVKRGNYGAVPKPLTDWQIENIKRAIEGTKASLAKHIAEGNEYAAAAHESYLNVLLKKLN